jgi:hypothetical protein
VIRRELLASTSTLHDGTTRHAHAAAGNVRSLSHRSSHRAQLHSRDVVVLQLAQGTLALRTHTRASTTFALSPPKLLGAEGRGLTPVACRAQAP